MNPFSIDEEDLLLRLARLMGHTVRWQTVWIGDQEISCAFISDKPGNRAEVSVGDFLGNDSIH